MLNVIVLAKAVADAFGKILDEPDSYQQKLDAEKAKEAKDKAKAADKD